MNKNILLIVFAFSFAFAHAQSDKTLVRQGNKLYQSDNYADAELNYRKALDKNPNSLSGTFNLADAMYEQENFEKSAEIFAKIGQADLAKDKKGMAYYNLGNSFLKAKQYEQSIEAFKMALRNNPDDENARYNLEYARKMLKQQQDQQKNQDKNKDQDKQDKKDQQDKNKDQNKDQDQKKDQDQNKDQQKDQQDKKDQNQDQKQENKDNQGKPEQQMNDQQSKQISKKDAERMLEALKNNEKKTLEKLKKGKKVNAKVVKKEKDW